MDLQRLSEDNIRSFASKPRQGNTPNVEDVSSTFCDQLRGLSAALGSTRARPLIDKVPNHNTARTRQVSNILDESPCPNLERIRSESPPSVRR